MTQKPLVSICTTTYNHARYLRQTLDSFLMQKCDFPFEILVHDDVSTDGTIDILREYAQKYPDIVKPLFEEENQYSKGVPINETFNFPRAQGKYIALCEGDDYWCDETKLARQIAHMEADPECTFCFTNGYIHDENGVAPDRKFIPYYESEREHYTGESACYSLDEIARLSFIPTASFVFRVDALRRLPDTFSKECQHGDLRMKLFLTAAGHAWYEHVYGCVYRENVSGSAMQIWKKEKRDQLYRRCSTVVEMVNDVNDYSRGTAEAGLSVVRDHYLWVMVHNAPSLKALLTGDVGKRLRRLPLKEQLRCIIRLVLPQKLAQSLSGKGA
ncbi:MAG: glycosyltransferase [Clostridia bacterium]|nr:glycosyltransferase [Clostridia bacterium]